MTLGIGGELPTRTSLFNDLCDDKLFDPFDRAPGCAAIRIRRGSGKRFHVHRVDGGNQVHEMPRDLPEDLAIVRHAAHARGELENRRRELDELERGVAVRPRWWAIWKWPGYIADLMRSGSRREQRRLAASVASDAHARFEHAERAAIEVVERTSPARDRYVMALRGLASGGAAGVGVAEIVIEVVSGMLPEGIEVLELTGASRASAEVDAVVVVETGGVYAPGMPGTRPRIGAVAETFSTLPQLLASARSLGISRRYRDKIAATIASLDLLIDQKETSFAKRISALESMRVTDVAGYTEIQLARVQPQIIASVNAVLEHASVHLNSELASVTNEWVKLLAQVTTGAELATAVSTIDTAWDATMKRVAEEVRLLAMGGVGGSARDLYGSLVAPLLQLGLPEADGRPPRAAPQLSPVSILPSLNAPTSKLDDKGFFASLFRSFENKRTEVRAKAGERLQRLHEVAVAELMDAEPKFHAAVREALINLLAGAIGIQTRYLDQALTRERNAIKNERADLAPLVAVRDAVRTDLARLAAEISRLETAQPALSIATTAAETASLSH